VLYKKPIKIEKHDFLNKFLDKYLKKIQLIKPKKDLYFLEEPYSNILKPLT
jgi:hypothetical protein